MSYASTKYIYKSTLNELRLKLKNNASMEYESIEKEKKLC